MKKEGTLPLVLDSGNLFFNQNPVPDDIKAQMRLKADLIAEAYKRIGIDALNVGELDLALGINYLLNKKKTFDLPFVSSNLVSNEGKTLFQPYIIKDVNGVKVAIFGLIPSTSSAGMGYKEDMRVLSPAETSKSLIERFKGKAELIILLSNLGQNEDERLAREVPGIDVIVGGRSRALLETPIQVGNTLIVQAGAQGKHIGKLALSVVEKGKGVKVAGRDVSGNIFVNSITPLDDKVSKDEEIDGMVKSYKEALGGLHSPKPQATPQEASPKSYTGEAACAVCHPRQKAFWKKTRHAGAYETLIKRNSHMDMECIGCHTTGYGVPGGFRLGVESPDLRNVQCEACHGPGIMHRGKGDIRSGIDAPVCRGCHDAEKDSKFDFSSAIGKVRCPI